MSTNRNKTPPKKGVNNAFLVNVGDDIALRHNDDAVLERHHCMLTFQILRDPACSLFAHADLPTYQQMRRTVITVCACVAASTSTDYHRQ